MKKKFLIGSVAVLGTLTLAAGVFASTGLNNSNNNNSYAWMNQMHQAMVSGDYNTWKATANQYGGGRMMRRNVNQANQLHRNLTGYGMMRSTGGRGMMGF